MRTTVFVFAVSLALAQGATVEKRESPPMSSGSYGSVPVQPSAYGPPSPIGSFAASQLAPAAAYSSDPLMIPQAAAAQGYSTSQAGYGSPTTSYSYSDPAGYTMQQGFEGFMVPSMYGSKWFAVIPWVIFAIGGAVLLPLLFALSGLLFPFLKLGKLFKKKAVADALIKGRFFDENPKLVNIAHSVFAALDKFDDIVNTKEN